MGFLRNEELECVKSGKMIRRLLEMKSSASFQGIPETSQRGPEVPLSNENCGVGMQRKH